MQCQSVIKHHLVEPLRGGVEVGMNDHDDAVPGMRGDDLIHPVHGRIARASFAGEDEPVHAVGAEGVP